VARCCSVLECVAGVLECVAGVLECVAGVLECVAGVLQGVAECRGVLLLRGKSEDIGRCCSVLKGVAGCCRMLQDVALEYVYIYRENARRLLLSRMPEYM